MINPWNWYSNSLLYNTTSIQTITNTVTETSQFNNTNAMWSRTIKANMLKIWDILNIRTRVLLTTGSGQDSTLRVKFWTVEVVASTGTLPNGLAGNYAELDFNMKILSLGTTGTLCGLGRTFIHTGSGISQVNMRPLVCPWSITIDTTISNTIDLTYQWANASTGNILEIRGAMIEYFN